MKRVLVVVFTLVVFFSSLALVDSEPVILNPSFTDNFDSWTNHLNFAQISGTTFKTGPSSAGVRYLGDEAGYVYQNIPVAQNTDYVLSGWMNATDGPQETFLQAGTFPKCRAYADQKNTWIHRNCSFTTGPVQTSIQIRLVVNSSSFNHNSGYFDDISLVEAPSCVPDTCVSLGVSCGTFDDGCGTPLDCGPVLFNLFWESNSHSELASQSNYNFSACGLSAVCDGSNNLISLSEDTNSHVSAIPDATYTTTICSDSCYIQSNSCTGTDVVAASLYSLSNSHVSLGNDPNYRYKICCGVSGPSTGHNYWADMNGRYTNSVVNGSYVRLVSVDGPPYELFKDGLYLSDITENYWMAGEISISGYFFNSSVAGESNDSLVVSNTLGDETFFLDILEPGCSMYNITGHTRTIVINASDPDDLISGNVSINGVNVKDFTNSQGSLIQFDYTFNDPGNVQIVVSANNSRGYKRRKLINVMIADISPSADETQYYVSSCIDKPVNFEVFPSSRVEFDALSSKGIRFNKSDQMFNVITPDRLLFNWTFYSRSTREYRYCNGLGTQGCFDGHEGTVISFNRTFPSVEDNFAYLSVSIPDNEMTES